MRPHHHLRRHPADADTDSPQPRASRPRTNNHAATQPQFQTPPSRDMPQLNPSPMPVQSVESVHPAAAAQAAIFSLFGRGAAARQRPQMMDEDDGEESQRDEGDTFAHEDPRRMTLDPEGNEMTLSDEEAAGMMEGEEEEVVEAGEEDEDEMMQEEGMLPSEVPILLVLRFMLTQWSTICLERSPSPLPSNLREISSLASWTVSTHKPGYGVAALRHPSPEQYWQSDGPQPHTLSLHFFKLVAVVRIRVYLDFEMDESYTPTKMVFLAGMGGNDLVEFATWEGEGPCGWVNIPLEGVGGRSGGWVRKKKRKRTRATNNNTKRGSVPSSKSPRRASGLRPAQHYDDYMFSESDAPVEYDEGAYEDDNDETADEDDEDDPYAGSVLKAMVLQMRIIENHQNGKDTHVRGFQVFARDDDRRRVGTAPSASADGRIRRQSVRKSFAKDGERPGAEDGEGRRVTGLEEPDWMGEPVIR